MLNKNLDKLLQLLLEIQEKVQMKKKLFIIIIIMVIFIFKEEKIQFYQILILKLLLLKNF